MLSLLLKAIRREVSGAAGKPATCLAIFDLDSTLFDLTLRVTAIMDRFARSPESLARFPDACRKLRDIEIRRTDWGLSQPLQRIGISSKTDPEFVRALERAWVEGFFSNDFLDRDFPLPGAVNFVEECLNAGADVIYLTGRDVKRMGLGTESSLRHAGFPLDRENVKLELKPHADLDDAEFKADFIQELAPDYDHIWFFENEPVNINLVVKRVPKVKIVFIDTCHSGLESVTNALATVQHFEIPISDLE